eukprot:jgi/Botrbrau1/4815/Bobra.0325s0034.1
MAAKAQTNGLKQDLEFLRKNVQGGFGQWWQPDALLACTPIFDAWWNGICTSDVYLKRHGAVKKEPVKHRAESNIQSVVMPPLREAGAVKKESVEHRVETNVQSVVIPTLREAAKPAEAGPVDDQFSRKYDVVSDTVANASKCRRTVAGLLLGIDMLPMNDEAAEEIFWGLLLSLLRVVRDTESGPKQLVAAFSDPDPHVVYNALAFSRLVFSVPDLASRMRMCNVVPELLSVFSRPNLYYKAAVGAAVYGAAGDNFMVHSLCEKGIVAEMVKTLKEGFVTIRSAIVMTATAHFPKPHKFTERLLRPPGWTAVEWPLGDLHLVMCAVLTRLVTQFQGGFDVVGEVARIEGGFEGVVVQDSRDIMNILLDSLMHYSGEAGIAPAQLLSCTLVRLEEQALNNMREKLRVQARYPKYLLADKLRSHPDCASVISNLLKFRSDRREFEIVLLGFEIVFQVIYTLGRGCLHQSAKQISAAIIGYIEPTGPNVERAVRALYELAF